MRFFAKISCTSRSSGLYLYIPLPLLPLLLVPARAYALTEVRLDAQGGRRRLGCAGWRFFPRTGHSRGFFSGRRPGRLHPRLLRGRRRRRELRLFGSTGCLLAFLVFGITGAVAIPALFVLGVQSLLAARVLASRFLGEGKRPSPYGKAYFLRCGGCAAALCVCVLLEQLVVPALISGMAGLLAAA